MTKTQIQSFFSQLQVTDRPNADAFINYLVGLGIPISTQSQGLYQNFQILDSSASYNHGVLIGDTLPTLIPSSQGGDYKSAIRFNGTDGVNSSGVDIGYKYGFPAGTPFNFRFWVYPEVVGGAYRTFFSKSDFQSQGCLGAIDSNGRAVFFCGAGIFRTNLSLTANTWQFLDYDYNGNTLSIRINGVESFSQNVGGINVSGAAFQFLLGRLTYSPSNGSCAPITGSIDDFQVSNISRAPILPVGPLTPDANTVGLYHFDMLDSDFLSLKKYTPSGKADTAGVPSSTVYDDSNIYVKTSGGWSKAPLTLLP